MEFDENNEVEKQNGNTEQDSEDAVEIYSKWAIWGFSIFFGTIFGGVLLVSNLRAVGLKKAANTVLIFSIFYFIFSAVIAAVAIKMELRYLSLLLNIGGAAILTGYFFNKYFPEDDYYPKSITKPLIISIAITFALFIIVYYVLQSTGNADILKQLQK